MGFVRLTTAKIWVFGIFWVRTLKVSSDMIKNYIKKNRLIFDVFIHGCSIILFDCLLDFGNQNHFFPMKKIQPFMLLGVVLGKKSSNDSRLTVIALNVVRHVPRASGPFL